VFNNSGFTDKNYPVIRDLIAKTEPDYWQLLQPNDIVAYFVESKNGKERCEYLVSLIKELKKDSTIFNMIGLASSVDQFVFETSWLGKIKTQPIGNTSKASELARLDSSY
jgi:hypothetical protein